MHSDEDPDRARTVGDAWRSAGAHHLARQLVLVTRAEGASVTLQAEIAAIVIATEEPVTEAIGRKVDAGRCMQRHRHQEFIRFLNAVEASVPAGKVIHVVLDNYAAHKHPRVRAWLVRNPRWTFHFTPTSASWMNAVEGFFSALTRRRLKRGEFASIVDLQAAIRRYITAHNNEPKPFVWTKPADAIMAKIDRQPEPFE